MQNYTHTREYRRFCAKYIMRPIKIAGQWMEASMKRLKPSRRFRKAHLDDPR